MIGLALEGGGVKGSYQAGVYAALYEANIKIDGVCGTSIGAINAAIIASGKGEYLPQIWRSLNMSEVFGFSSGLGEVLNSKKINLQFWEMIGSNLLSVLINRGIELKGVKKIIDEYVDEDKIRRGKMDFGVCTVRLKDLKPMYVFKEDMKNSIKEYVIASCYLPIFRLEKIIDDNYYLDGGFYDLGPVNMLINKGYKTIYLVKIHGPGFRRKYSKDANVIVIESKRTLGKVIELDKNRVIENIKMGYYDALRVIKNYDGIMYVFKRKSDKYYKYINRYVSKSLYHRVSMFFKTKNKHETTIKALEYVMEKVGIDYYKVYKPAQIIRYLQKNYDNSNFVFKYIKHLKHFIR